MCGEPAWGYRLSGYRLYGYRRCRGIGTAGTGASGFVPCVGARRPAGRSPDRGPAPAAWAVARRGSGTCRAGGPAPRRRAGPAERWSGGPVDRRSDGATERRTSGAPDRRTSGAAERPAASWRLSCAYGGTTRTGRQAADGPPIRSVRPYGAAALPRCRVAALPIRPRRAGASRRGVTEGRGARPPVRRAPRRPRPHPPRCGSRSAAESDDRARGHSARCPVVGSSRKEAVSRRGVPAGTRSRRRSTVSGMPAPPV
jgi:hypothetical protein